MLIPCEQNAGQDHNTETDIKSLKNTTKFNNPNNLNKPNCLRDEIKGRLNSANVFYHSV